MTKSPLSFEVGKMAYAFRLDHWPEKRSGTGSKGRAEMWDLWCEYGPYRCCVPVSTAKGLPPIEDQALRIVDRFAEAGHLVSGLTVEVKKLLPAILKEIEGSAQKKGR